MSKSIADNLSLKEPTLSPENTPSSPENTTPNTHYDPKRDRVSQFYYGIGTTEKNAEILRKRVHWMCNEAVGEKVLDVGCSEGITTIICARNGKRVTGIDINEDALNYARTLLKKEDAQVQSRVNFLLGQAEDSELLKPNGFDTILCGEVIEHLANPDTFLTKLSASLTLNGRLIITTPFGFLPHPDHLQSFTMNSLFEALPPSTTLIKLNVLEHKYVCLVLEKTASNQACYISQDLKIEAWKLTEDTLLSSQEKYFSETERLKSKIGQLNEKLTSSIATSKERYSNETERLKSKIGQLSQELENSNKKLASSSIAASKSLADSKQQQKELKKVWRLFEKTLAVNRQLKSDNDFYQSFSELQDANEHIQNNNPTISEVLAIKSIQSFIQKKGFELAKSLSLTAISDIPRSVELRLLYVKILTTLGEKEEAIKQLNYTTLFSLKSHELLFKILTAFLKLGAGDEAALLIQFWKNDPSFGRFRNKLNSAFIEFCKLKIYEQTLSEPLKLLELLGSYNCLTPPLHSLYTICRAKACGTELSVAFDFTSVSNERNNFFLVADCLQNLGETNLATNLIDLLITDRQNSHALERLIKILLQTKQYARVLDLLKNPEIKLKKTIKESFLFEANYGLGNLELAEHILSNFFRSLPTKDRASQLTSFALIMKRLGLVERAEDNMRKALELDPTFAPAHFELARSLRNTGNYLPALESAKKALYLSPERLPYRQLLEIIEGDLNVYENCFVPKVDSIANYSPIKSNILHVMENSLPHRSSGYTIRSLYIMENQRSLGFMPHVITRPGFPRDSNIYNFSKVESYQGISFFRPETDGPGNYNRVALDRYLQTYANEIRIISESIKPSILHATSNFKNGYAAHAVANALNIPWVYELRGLWEDTQVANGIIDENDDRYKYFRRCEEFCLSNANAVVTISHTLKSELVIRGISSEKIFIVPNAVEPEKFPVVERNPNLAKELGLTDKVTLGYISSIVNYEGIEILILGFHLLLQSDKNLRLLIVGDGSARAKLEELVASLNIQEFVIFTGKVPHDTVLDYYSLIDIFVVPRLPLRVCEIVTPLKPYEAMSTGRCLVVSDVAALKEMVLEDQTGKTFKAGSPESLAEVCKQLINSPETRKELAKKAAQWVRENRTWPEVSKTYLEVYKYAQLSHSANIQK